MPRWVLDKFSNRIIEDVAPSRIRLLPFPELKAYFMLLWGKNRETVFYQRNKSFQKSIPDWCLKEADVVIGFDTSSWLLAERCRRLKTCFILDVSIAHPLTKESVYEQIIKDFPDWSFALDRKDQRYITLEQQEMELANIIVVASSFTRSTLCANGIPEKKIRVNPYGVDSNAFRQKEKVPGTGIKFVFVGLVDARKGIPLLLQVWRKLEKKKSSLTLIGPVSENIRKHIRDNHPGVNVFGKVPFDILKGLLAEYDVLVFPSYFEGYGLVIPEAMACGLPVITTRATCGPDIMENGKEGFVIESGDIEGLGSSMQYFIDNPEKMLVSRQWARQKAISLSWDNYGLNWGKIISYLPEAE